jgi:DNA-3-methyladenine glycosylase II
MAGRIIAAEADLAEGTAWLVHREPRFQTALDKAAPLPLRRNVGGFAALLNIVMGQQVSVASAKAIWRRLEAAGLTEAKAIAVAREEDLRACGLSRQKIRYATALAHAGVDFAAFEHVGDDHVIAALVALPGIGRWTAEVYAMFSLGRADVFSIFPTAPLIRRCAGWPKTGRPGDRLQRARSGLTTGWPRAERVFHDARIIVWGQRGGFGKGQIACGIPAWLRR